MKESSHCFFLILKILTPVGVDIYLNLSFLDAVNVAILSFTRFVLMTFRDLLTKNPIPKCSFPFLSRNIRLKALFLLWRRYSLFGFFVWFYFHLPTWTCQFSTWKNFSELFSLSAMDHRPAIAGQRETPWDCHGHQWGPLGMSWTSVNCTAVSVRARSGPNSKPHRFHHNCVEMLIWKLWNFLSQNFLLNHEFLILHDVD